MRDSYESVPHNHADLVSSIDGSHHVVEHFSSKLLDDISPECRAVAVHLIKPLAYIPPNHIHVARLTEAASSGWTA
jgi:hypothetical protein